MSGQEKTPFAWPNDARFALFLSHDIDKIFDKELFYFLAGINHIRRVLLQSERGSVKLALRRLIRSAFAPKPPVKDFDTILEMEKKFGFRSTFFILHDSRRGRRGPRYSLTSPVLKQIVELIRTSDGEIGLHGGYYQFNNPDGYQASRVALRNELGVEAVGIRNHFLRHSGADTWQAQQDAGFTYDASFGYKNNIGSRDGHMFPFYPPTNSSICQINVTPPYPLLVLPLTLMDTALFGIAPLNRDRTMELAWKAILPVIEAGGLVSLLWHNDGFNEPEYADWQWTYERLLERLAEKEPWCATGAEIAKWWKDTNC